MGGGKKYAHIVVYLVSQSHDRLNIYNENHYTWTNGLYIETGP